MAAVQTASCSHACQHVMQAYRHDTMRHLLASTMQLADTQVQEKQLRKVLHLLLTASALATHGLHMQVNQQNCLAWRPCRT
jgi:hypothetical protein